MIKALCFGVSAGAGIQAWRNFPADGPVTVNSAVLVSVVGMFLAYWAGRWFGRGGARATAVAVATAEATAVASNQVNVALIVPGHGAHPFEGVSVPGMNGGELPAWMGSERAAITAQDLDGADLADLSLDYPESEPVQ